MLKSRTVTSALVLLVETPFGRLIPFVERRRHAGIVAEHLPQLRRHRSATFVPKRTRVIQLRLHERLRECQRQRTARSARSIRTGGMPEVRIEHHDAAGGRDSADRVSEELVLPRPLWHAVRTAQGI